MEKRRSFKKGETVKTVDFAFYFVEASSFIGGPGGYLNTKIADLETLLDVHGGRRPYGISFGGGDGVVSPVVMTVFEAQG